MMEMTRLQSRENVSKPLCAGKVALVTGAAHYGMCDTISVSRVKAAQQNRQPDPNSRIFQ